jgi:hypothetical protein
MAKARKAEPSLTPIEDDRLERIVDAVSKLEFDDLEKFGAWHSLDSLSSQTVFEGVEVHPDGVFDAGKGNFEAVATAYVTLQYGGKREHTAMSDSYPAKISGTIDSKGNVQIKSVTVDTSSFYE